MRPSPLRRRPPRTRMARCPLTGSSGPGPAVAVAAAVVAAGAAGSPAAVEATATAARHSSGPKKSLRPAAARSGRSRASCICRRRRAPPGVLVSAKANYLPSPKDPLVPRDLINREGLEAGAFVTAVAVDGNRPVVRRIELVEGLEPGAFRQRSAFNELISIDPNSRMKLETEPDEMCGRVVDLLAPDRPRPALPDRGAPEGRQDDPLEAHGPRRRGQRARRARDRAPDRRAPGGDHRLSPQRDARRGDRLFGRPLGREPHRGRPRSWPSARAGSSSAAST